MAALAVIVPVTAFATGARTLLNAVGGQEEFRVGSRRLPSASLLHARVDQEFRGVPRAPTPAAKL